jgi:hypothetical protein
MIDRQMLVAPLLKLTGKSTVMLRKKWPIQKALVCHFIYPALIIRFVFF